MGPERVGEEWKLEDWRWKMEDGIADETCGGGLMERNDQRLSTLPLDPPLVPLHN